MIDKLAQLSRVVELPGHRNVFHEGAPIEAAHFLLSGSVKRYARQTGESEKVLELVGPGQAFALSEIFTADTYASFADTLQPSSVLMIPIPGLRALMSTHLALSMRLLDAVAGSYYASEFDVVRHRSRSVTQRVLDYLLSLSSGQRQGAGETTVRLVASKRVIAARLDMAPETLSRTLRQLSDDGLIVVDKRTVHIQNAAIQLTAPSSGEHEPTSPPKTVHYPRLDRSSEPRRLSQGEWVNLCGRQRMLSQRLASHWLMIQRSVLVQESRVGLRKHKDQFERNLRKLALMDWPAPLQAHLDQFHEAWTIYAERLTRPCADAMCACALFAQSEAILTAADPLTGAVARHPTRPEAAIINTAGRNRMLCARLIKLFLFAEWGIRPETTSSLMVTSRTEFQNNLALLRHAAAHSPQALAQLTIDESLWTVFLQCLDKPATQESQHRLAVIHAGDALLRQADTTVKVYEHLFDLATGVQARAAL
ncbi:MAG: type IV pili methyl-accepting chemotaxis transducer N-terminal domain-containing protein [Rhodocyclaceae bacterium]|nr:type IV pili methyl-accepting chemotaxis transducer N-terminal domain-containing protein [Rhodocyclaceae bacterium]